MHRFMLILLGAGLVNLSGCQTIIDFILDDDTNKYYYHQQEAISRAVGPSGSERADYDAMEAYGKIPGKPPIRRFN